MAVGYTHYCVMCASAGAAVDDDDGRTRASLGTCTVSRTAIMESEASSGSAERVAVDSAVCSWLHKFAYVNGPAVQFDS